MEEEVNHSVAVSLEEVNALITERLTDFSERLEHYLETFYVQKD